MEENKFLKEQLMDFSYVFWSVVFGCLLSMIPAMLLAWFLEVIGFEANIKDPLFMYYLGAFSAALTSCMLMWVIGNEQIRSNYKKG